MLLVVLAVGWSLVQAQTNSACGVTSCLNPSACKSVTLDPIGLDPKNSPYYPIMAPNVTGTYEYDNSCVMCFALGDHTYLVLETVVNKDETYSIITSIRGNIAGSRGAYRYEGKDPSLACGSCVYNDFTIKALQDECEGLYLVYRCPIYGDCVNVYNGQDIVYLASSAVATNSAPSCCVDAAVGVAQQQGLRPPISLPNKLHRRCVTRVNGLTAINAQFVAPEDAMEIDDSSCD